MALIRVAQYSSTPGPVTDYQAQNAHLQAFTNQLMTQQFILDSGTAQPVIKQGCYVSHGGSLYIADADTPITGSPSDGSVYIRVSGTTSLTVEFVTSISGYVWNPVYTALTSGSYTLLPYLIVKASTVWNRYNFNPNDQQFGSLASLVVNGNTTVGGALGVSGAISGASINTGGLGNFLIGQNLRTTDSPTFAGVECTVSLSAGANDIGFSLLSGDGAKSTSYVLLKTYTIQRLTGAIRIYGTIRPKADGPSDGRTYHMQFKYNGVEVYVATTTSSLGTVDFNFDLSIEPNGVLTIYTDSSSINHRLEYSNLTIKASTAPTNLLQELAITVENDNYWS